MLKVIPMGGLGEIGLNMMVLQYETDAVVIDAGLMFPNDFMPGVDLVIPDFRYLKEIEHMLKAIILTHGHEDHIGAMPYFLREFDIPVYGTTFTLELLREKLKEHHLADQTDLLKIHAGEKTEIGPFTIEFIQVNHSIIGGVGLAVDTPDGILIHSGDFKIDPTPVDDQVTDLIRFAHFGERGVLALFSDSTNAEKEGFTLSERDVKKTLSDIFRSCSGRIIVASFASNICRIQQVINLAVEFDRKVVFNGKSMITNVNIAKAHGYLSIPEGTEIPERHVSRFSDDRIAIITTGSQGEPMSALTRMAQGKHKSIKIKKGDTIILSSRFIPGNEQAITTVINNLYRMGAEVIYKKVSDIHTSGHAKREELKIMLSLVKPKYFIPIHGEYRHLVKHAQVAMDMGMPKDHVMIVENGTPICFNKDTAHLGDVIHTGQILVDGKGVGDVGEIVLRDRRRLSGHGMVIVLLSLDEKTGERVYGPEIISRGFMFQEQADTMLEDARNLIIDILQEMNRSFPIAWDEIEATIQSRLKRFFYKFIERRPMILPIIIPA